MGREIECNLVQGTASETRASAQTKYDNLSTNNSYPQLGGGTPDTPPSVVGNFTLICKLSQTRFGGGVYRTASSTQTSSFTVPSYLAFSPVSGVAESADLDDVKVIGYKLYEKIALLDGSENGNAGSSNTNYIERAFHYDRKGRVMQVVEKNSTGGISRTSTKYDFRGNILAVNENHSAGSLTITKGSVYSYDQRERLLSERVSINGVDKATVNYSYDALGNLTGKSYGNGIVNAVQYNIQGWRTQSLMMLGNEMLYAQKLRYYDAEKGNGLYNGNISEWKMQHRGSAINTYTYSYDGLGRLTESSRFAGNGTSATNSWCERGIDYDLNGNIVTLQRFGSSASTVEDNLIYGYTGNRLTALTGSSQGAELNASYSYDAGGNMLYDGRRGLEISYNILNLPAKVVERTGATAADGAVKAEYLYSADGIKQRVVDGAGSNGYLYLGTLVLSKSGESYSLASTGFGGGRIIGGAGNSCLAYYYGTDHLGSVRVITDGSGSVVERNDYYPLGMRTSTGNSYPQLTTNLYKYNGKEVQTVGGLGFTDYGARMYDDFTGRWFVQDPLAEKYVSMSPYMYCGGNPINAIDVDGRSTWVVRAGKGKYEVVGGNLYDNDRNIYVGTLDKKNNKFTREYSIGITTSITSFYHCDAKEGPKWSEESIIDVNDRSGYEFLRKIISQNPPMIDDYMLNARTGHRYDFKVTNGTDHKIEGIDIYRGMPVGVTAKGQVIFSSARDIGNIAAGFIAGVNGIDWMTARSAFDLYQGEVEGISSQNAQRYGWILGYYGTNILQKRYNIIRSVVSALDYPFKLILRKNDKTK